MKPSFFKTLLFTAVILFSSTLMAQIYKPKVPRDFISRTTEIALEDFILCNIHPNFGDIVQHLYVKSGHGNDAYVILEVTTVDPAQKFIGTPYEKPSHYFTSWSRFGIRGINDPCADLNSVGDVRFSDRNLFAGRTDLVEYSFDTKENSVTITLKSWGDATKTYYNLIRKGSVLYHVDTNGEITAFNMFLGRGVIQ